MESTIQDERSRTVRAQEAQARGAGHAASEGCRAARAGRTALSCFLKAGPKWLLEMIDLASSLSPQTDAVPPERRPLREVGGNPAEGGDHSRAAGRPRHGLPNLETWPVVRSARTPGKLLNSGCRDPSPAVRRWRYERPLRQRAAGAWPLPGFRRPRRVSGRDDGASYHFQMTCCASALA